MEKTVAIGVGLAALLLASDEGKNITNNLVTTVQDFFTSRLIIPKEEFRTQTAIKLSLQNIHPARRQVRDGYHEPLIEIGSGEYQTIFQNGTIHISINAENVITLWSWKWPIFGQDPGQFLQDYISAVYQQYCRPEQRIFYNIVADNEWFPVTRRPRAIQEFSKLAAVTQYIDEFMQSEEKYADHSHPYRLGLLVRGPKGSYKSSLPEWVATKYDMPVYIININDGKKMTPASLIKLVSQIPERSVIIFDEIDKQLKENGNADGIYSGILSAIDGPQRLSYGSIVIFTANSQLDEKLAEHLIRPGRIDQEFILN